eukprot:TRINITY_DN92427_c0_g1_i1.p1 TRINITY_DN92427_c0_g1~~TRINITY_DN92427_c0_g1_i1.p1  ORF type:complete len:295 (-),score=34.77 TRINITY_DN92427_c0_g1_i1:171-1055(-)
MMEGRPAWQDSVYDPSLGNARRSAHTRTYFSVYERCKEKSVEESSAMTRASRAGIWRGRWRVAAGAVCPCCGRAQSPEPRARASTKGDPEDASTAASSTSSPGIGISNVELTSSLARAGTEPDAVREQRRLESERRALGALPRSPSRASPGQLKPRKLEKDFELAAKQRKATPMRKPVPIASQAVLAELRKLLAKSLPQRNNECFGAATPNSEEAPVLVSASAASKAKSLQQSLHLRGKARAKESCHHRQCLWLRPGRVHRRARQASIETHLLDAWTGTLCQLRAWQVQSSKDL